MKADELLNDPCMRVGQVHTRFQCDQWQEYVEAKLNIIKLDYGQNARATDQPMSPNQCASIAFASIKGMISEGKQRIATSITRAVYDTICAFVDSIRSDR